MKTKILKITKSRYIKYLLTLSVLFLAFGLISAYGQDFNKITQKVDSWKDGATKVAKAIIAVAAIIGAIWVYFKMQNDDGGSGRKALMSYLGGLAFAVIVWILIDAFLK